MREHDCRTIVGAALLLSLSVGMMACARSAAHPPATTPASGVSYATSAMATGPVKLPPITFAEDAFVRDAIRNECQLETKIPQFITRFGRDQSVDVIPVPSTGESDGRVLVIEISDITETGNAWVGRQKSMTLKGTLSDNGVLVGSFKARRSTMGGYYGAYKGHCAFLGRCAKALGKDVAIWLKNPSLKSQIGE